MYCFVFILGCRKYKKSETLSNAQMKNNTDVNI